MVEVPLPPWMVGQLGILGAWADANKHLVLEGALMGQVEEVLRGVLVLEVWLHLEVGEECGV